MLRDRRQGGRPGGLRRPGALSFGQGAGGGFGQALGSPGDARRDPPPDPREPSPERAYGVPNPFGDKSYRWQSAKLLRDRLHDKMCDWAPHGVDELESWMPEREWVRAMLDLLHFGWAFDRVGLKLRLRRALPGEPRQSVVDLLSGLTVRSEVGERARGEGREDAGGESTDGAGEGERLFEGGGEEAEVAPEDEVVLDADRTMILAATEFVPETCGILARKGRGKTYLAMVLAEELLRSTYEIPFVVVDPTGCWYGLLADALGEPSSNRIALLGGERGHFPLPSGAGRLAARTAIACRPLPLILDLSLMSLPEQHGFVADFSDELYLHNREAVHVFVDEVDIFAPQRLEKSSRQHGRCLAAVDTLVRRGRFRGVGNTLVSQRPAVVNKNVLSQVGAMFFMQLGAPQDLSAVSDWLHTNIRREVREACLAELPVLGMGISYYLRGGDRPMFRRFKVRAKTTFDSSRTPKFNEKAKVAKIGELGAEDRAALEACYGREAAALSAVAPTTAPEGEAAEPEARGSQEVAAILGVQHGDDGEDPAARLTVREEQDLIRVSLDDVGQPDAEVDASGDLDPSGLSDPPHYEAPDTADVADLSEEDDGG